jgi:hypothetical protein
VRLHPKMESASNRAISRPAGTPVMPGNVFAQCALEYSKRLVRERTPDAVANDKMPVVPFPSQLANWWTRMTLLRQHTT